MPSIFLSGKDKNLCLVKHNSSFSAYKLEGTEESGFKFYGRFQRFEIGLTLDEPLSEQPYGFLGSLADLTGRAISGFSQGKKSVISSSGTKKLTLESPIYSLIGNYDEKDFLKLIEKYSTEQQDIPYACISTSALAVGDAGDDLYLNKLFFMTRGYGILAEMSAVAGRDIEDCISPEYHYRAHKLRLDKANPLKRIRANDIVSGADPICWTVSASPEIINPVEITKTNDSKKIETLDALIDELYITLVPENTVIS